MANRYSVLLEFLKNLNSHSVFKFEGKIKFIAVTYFKQEKKFCVFGLNPSTKIIRKLKILFQGACTTKTFTAVINSVT
jgi:hypothetical protein